MHDALTWNRSDHPLDLNLLRAAHSDSQIDPIGVLESHSVLEEVTEGHSGHGGREGEFRD